MIVRFPNACVYHNFRTAVLSWQECKRKNVQQGKVTLSLKCGKRRKLVSGMVTIHTEYYASNLVRSEYFLFTPNNREKFFRVLNYEKAKE